MNDDLYERAAKNWDAVNAEIFRNLICEVYNIPYDVLFGGRNKIMKYRKKPVIVEAVQWTGFNFEEISDFADGHLRFEVYDAAWEAGAAPARAILYVHTLEGEVQADQYDFIIKGVNGEFYPCKPDIFAKTYEVVR